ncbi:13934_t:CDS:2, partial [Dentiscutata heterogama]
GKLKFNQNIKMTTNLSNKILQAIFKLLDSEYKRDYYGTLFNCALVNRQWCDNAIPILHRLPLIENKKFDYPSFIRYINLNIIWEALYVLYSPNTSNSEPPNDPNLFNDIESTLTLYSSKLDEYSNGDIKNNILELLLQPKISDLLSISKELLW